MALANSSWAPGATQNDETPAGSAGSVAALCQVRSQLMGQKAKQVRVECGINAHRLDVTHNPWYLVGKTLKHASCEVC